MKRMKTMRIGRYLKELESNNATPKSIRNMLKDDNDYKVILRKEGEKTKVTIKKARKNGSDMAFMGYKDGKWEVPYGNLCIVDEIIEKIKSR
ncbi:MAG: hypothetical protein ACE5J7_02665 [Candidatus Aenigmatarchaeota archaeon]